MNSRWIKDLNLKSEAIKVLGENIGSKLLNIVIMCGDEVNYTYCGDQFAICTNIKMIT